MSIYIYGFSIYIYTYTKGNYRFWCSNSNVNQPIVLSKHDLWFKMCSSGCFHFRILLTSNGHFCANSQIENASRSTVEMIHQKCLNGTLPLDPVQFSKLRLFAMIDTQGFFRGPWVPWVLWVRFLGNECFEPWPMGFPNMGFLMPMPSFSGEFGKDVARATKVGPRKMGNPGL